MSDRRKGSHRYKRMFGMPQESVYEIMIRAGLNEKRIQEDYGIPQASLRRCRHRFLKKYPPKLSEGMQ